ncbi:MAG TPA: hypothetical protein VJL89_07925 [Thermodesulfovibrionia bacterium]|nr:hypothetical protein [Thermodesulfovibrionia bacterium]
MGGYGSILKIVPELSPHLNAAFLVLVYIPSAYIEAFVDFLVPTFYVGMPSGRFASCGLRVSASK